MTLLRRCAFYSTVLLFLVALPGCLITTQSFNHGKLLNPGERIITHGFGWRYSTRLQPVMLYDSTGQPAYDTNHRDSDGFSTLMYQKDPARYGWCTYTLDYRVGVLRKYPFGKGLETGFHVEAAFRINHRQQINGRYEQLQTVVDSTTGYQVYSNRFIPTDTSYRSEPEFYGPPVLEIDTRFGLPDIIMREGIMHHNVNIGWIVGYWVDNGWFAGYAAGWEFQRFIPYCSVRFFRSATYALNRVIDTDFFSKHNQKWGGRLTSGVSYRLPSNFSIVPEFITPECSFTFPNYSAGQRIGFNASLGIRWMLGQ